MTDLRQAAQQALEALETCREDEWHSEDDFGMEQTYDEDKVAKALTALRTTLKQPRQEPKPVACRFCHSKKGCYTWLCDSCGEIDDVQQPAAQRPWVGLTDEEILSADPRIGKPESDVNPYQILGSARDLEALLKERNT